MNNRYQVPQGASEWGPTGRRRPNESLPSVDELRQALRYDPATGQFWWTRKVAINTPAGSPAGYVKEGRYVVIRFRGAHLAGHRVAWAMHYGEWPPHNVDVDHINQVKHDNRIENLRLVTRRINVLNAKVRSNSRSGVSGVRWHKATGKWAAAMCIHGQYAHIGLYPTIEEAVAAKEKAERDILGHSQDDAHSLLRMRLAAAEAERDTLRAENEKLRASNRGICALADERVAEIHRLRRENALLRSGIVPDGEYLDGVADGANLRTVGERVMSLEEDFGVPVC